MTTAPIASTPRLPSASSAPAAARPPEQGPPAAHTMPCSRYLREIQSGDGTARQGMLERMAADNPAACRARAIAGAQPTATG